MGPELLEVKSCGEWRIWLWRYPDGRVEAQLVQPSGETVAKGTVSLSPVGSF
jgi:hypothetical protein